MALLKIESTSDSTVFLNLAGVRAGVLARIGHAGKKHLFHTHLRTSDFFLKSLTDVKGRRTVSYQVSKNAEAVVIRAYPMNLWENDLYRYGRVYPGKKIFTKKFPGTFRAEAERIAAETLSKIVKKANDVDA